MKEVLILTSKVTGVIVILWGLFYDLLSSCFPTFFSTHSITITTGISALILGYISCLIIVISCSYVINKKNRANGPQNQHSSSQNII
ncbi:hypothetical protein [Priestia sp. TSO9]|uniref:hypothetical protein n=1 Tax=Priestia sp. TSO9 TaxID=2885632 RepID=UPI001E42D9A4|nr:hypothetical protein [Priestia sp. TSO9]